MLAPALMVQGTASDVGKSVLVTALCRFYRRRGLRVAPFKSQNMALNSFATPDGLEIGRAQAVQAAAAGLSPHVDMNPILLKPTAETRAQVVVMGKPVGALGVGAYQELKPQLGGVIEGCLTRLRSSHDLVLIEGAGSPAEINLRERDIANMFVAELADAQVLLAGDIDRGGVFAAFVGTLALLPEHERARVAALVINKFRGERSLLDPGLTMLEERTGIPVAGVLPFLRELRLADEDSVALQARPRHAPGSDELFVAVLRLPHLSNYDDLLALEHEPGVAVRFVDDAGALEHADLLILPGTKSTVADLRWLRERGLEPALRRRAQAGRPTLGICGGFQMLGRRIVDAHGVEAQPGEHAGLGLLPCETRYAPDKVTRQVRFDAEPSFLTDGQRQTRGARGYEIHMGRVETDEAARALLTIDGAPAGCQNADGSVAGTLVHGLLDDDGLRHALLAGLRRTRGLSAPAREHLHSPDAEYERLADAVEEHLDVALLERLARGER